jgi:hypothetical protein
VGAAVLIEENATIPARLPNTIPNDLTVRDVVKFIVFSSRFIRLKD